MAIMQLFKEQKKYFPLEKKERDATFIVCHNSKAFILQGER